MLDDRELVVRVLAGDVRAFEAIYDRHCDQVFGLAMYITRRQRAAEEATQDAFLNLWRSADRYDPRRGTLKTWLLTLVRNRSIDWLRREARQSRDVELDDAIAGRLEAPERTDEQAATREESRHARQLLGSIPTEQRQVIELAYFKGLTQAEIAVKIGIPLGTVKGRQRLGLTKMHHQLTTVSEGALCRPTPPPDAGAREPT
ncbi:MAG: sigma-70 family RNA polymerase sigma factor [Solirubrobacteraceae bacterium]